MIQVRILSWPHLNALASLVGIKELFSSEPLVFELFIETVHFRSLGFGVDVFTINQFRKLFLGNGDVALSVGPEQEYLLQIFSYDVAPFDQQKLTFSKKSFRNNNLFKVDCSKIVQIVLEKKDIFFMIGNLPKGFSS